MTCCHGDNLGKDVAEQAKAILANASASMSDLSRIACVRFRSVLSHVMTPLYKMVDMEWYEDFSWKGSASYRPIRGNKEGRYQRISSRHRAHWSVNYLAQKGEALEKP